MQKWSEWNHKDNESKGKWGRTTRDVLVRVKPKSKLMTPKREPRVPKTPTKNVNLRSATNKTWKANETRGVIETMTQWHATMKEKEA